MSNKEFIQKYEELLDSGYCECNELNCLDNNSPRKILNIMKEQEQEIERLNKQIEEYQKALDETTSEKIDLENTIKEVREYVENYNIGMPYDHFVMKESLLEILDKGE